MAQLPLCVVGAGWWPGGRICRKTRCSWRLGGGLEAQFVVKYSVFGAWVGAWRHILTLFTVIPPLWLISGQAWEAHFDTIYCDPAPCADFRTSLGSTL